MASMAKCKFPRSEKKDTTFQVVTFLLRRVKDPGSK